MLKGSELLHHTYLCNLVHHLDNIGENRDNIVSIIQEPIWTPHNYEQHTLCDLVILYHDKTASACELKGSMGQRSKAVKQIKAGREYIEQVLEFDYRYGLFVVYNNDRYIWERIKW
jgi:hypothetical protein